MRAPTMELKRFVALEHSLAVLGFFFATLLLTAAVFYGGAAVGLRSGGLRVGGSPEIRKRPDFLGFGGDGCDVFDGDWVWDQSYPLYESKGCVFMDDGFRCNENGRPDDFYTKWRWQPRNCNLPRFDAVKMLEKLKNRRVVFVGDSIGRNQWESLLCMLSSAVTNKTSVYEVEGKPITKHTGFLVYRFEDFNCTIEYYRAPFIVLQSRPPPKSPKGVKTTLKLDRLDWTSDRWKSADILVLNSGHWWNTEKLTRVGCYFQEGEEVKMEMSVENAYRRSVETVINWVGNKVDMNRTQVFFRTYSPVHFRGGDWKNGGSCHSEKLPDLGPSPDSPDAHFNIVADVVSKHHGNNKTRARKMEFLNVTDMSARRKDGHASVYYLGPNAGPASLHRQDCSHWCLPGVPDSWNELLLTLFLKRESLNSTDRSQAS